MGRTLSKGLVIFTLTALAAAPATAGPPKDKDWPCIQRKVVNLSAGALWQGPPLDVAIEKWRDDPEVAALVPRLVSRRVSVEQAGTLVKTFADALKTDKEQRLTLVFAGVFSELDRLRSDIIRGIERLTRNQRRRVDEIQVTRRQMDEITGKAEKTQEDRVRLTELEQQLFWQLRIHEERESTLLYICETPVLLEQRAFALGQAIQEAMK
jgi:hypothetical protein